MASPVEVDELRRAGLDAGLDSVGIAPAEPLLRARGALEARRAAGLDGGMAFTYRNPVRSTSPSQVVAGARALVVGARRYPAELSPAPGGRRAGRVARYASSDQYGPLRQALGAMAAILRGKGWRAVVVADANSLVDREAAWLAGVGWFGKNANLLLPGRGSWFVLGTVVTDAPLPSTGGSVADGCGTCHRCLDGCPTGAIVAPGVVDARRCLAWLAQRRGVFPREYRVALGDRIYGCDDCQEVCPPNRPAAGVSPREDPAAEQWVDLVELLRAGDAELLARYGRWYIADRDPRWLRRTALVALGNVGDPNDREVVAVLCDYLAHADALLRAHALWAAGRLGRLDLASGLVDDPATEVQEEWRALAAT